MRRKESGNVFDSGSRALEYVINGRSPLEWIMDRYQVKVDSASGIENNPNDWCDGTATKNIF